MSQCDITSERETLFLRKMVRPGGLELPTFRFVGGFRATRDPRHFLTLEEAIDQANKQFLYLALQGFHFLFTVDYFNPPWYSRFEVVLPSGELRPLP